MYLMETVMYMLVIMVKLPSGIMVRNRGSSPGTRSIRWNVLEEQNITPTKCLDTKELTQKIPGTLQNALSNVQLIEKYQQIPT
jgi:hypothetical protein